jgi:hypothetical protein
MLINLHQLKTAGKTLEGIFYRNFKDKLFYLTKEQKNNEKIHIKNMYRILHKKSLKKKLKNKSVITGHMLFGAHKILSNSEIKYYTTLRDPFQRAKSYFFYMIKNNKFEITKIFKKKKIKFKDFCSFSKFNKKKLQKYGFSNRAIEEINLIVKNGQTRVISGNPKLSDFQSYKLAQKNIKKHFIGVGIFEMYEKSIAILGTKMKFKFPVFINKVNTSNYGRLAVKNVNKIRQEFILHNSFDLKLHKEYSSQLKQEINKRLIYYYFILCINKINSILQTFLRPLIKKIYLNNIFNKLV